MGEGAEMGGRSQGGEGARVSEVAGEGEGAGMRSRGQGSRGDGRKEGGAGVSEVAGKGEGGDKYIK